MIRHLVVEAQLVLAMEVLIGHGGLDISHVRRSSDKS